MNTRLTLAIAVFSLFLHEGRTEEPYEEPYWETKNPARIFDWDTLSLLLSTKISKVKIYADSPESLITQLQMATVGLKNEEKLRFSFKRELWEQPPQVSCKLELESENLLNLIRYVCELNGMTFSVKKGEIVFRPLLG